MLSIFNYAEKIGIKMVQHPTSEVYYKIYGYQLLFPIAFHDKQKQAKVGNHLT